MIKWTQEDVDRVRAKRQSSQTGAPVRSKYRNVKVRVDGIMWDSKHEAAHYHELKLRHAAGEIADLRWKVKFPLLCPVADTGEAAVVSEYIADFVYMEQGTRVVADTKGKLTALYGLKRKWLALQEHIVIREVYAGGRTRSD